MQKMNNYNQQDIHLFFDTAKYKNQQNKEKKKTYGKVYSKMILQTGCAETIKQQYIPLVKCLVKIQNNHNNVGKSQR